MSPAANRLALPATETVVGIQSFGGGSKIRTCDLQLMRLTSYRTATIPHQSSDCGGIYVNLRFKCQHFYSKNFVPRMFFGDDS